MAIRLIFLPAANEDSRYLIPDGKINFCWQRKIHDIAFCPGGICDADQPF